ncbi:hypothetical protein DPMN_171101 [Dreissena polymorpha]|uniref:Uncharacterized protein n=1 Tax=Dreissena polymorpha TaxID=45954 RepID=A0A9D4DXH6_DREPO|nr:hypothetical protein DPMN_171101 [Dreissena polymorpha]
MDQSTIVAYLRNTNTIELVEFNEGKITAVKEIHPKTTYKGVFGIEPLGRLVCVSENKGTIDILNKDGKIVQECTLDDHASRTVNIAKFCAFNNRNQIIYMSCCELYKVIGINMSGHVVFEHHLGDYAVPSQCAIGTDNSIYVTVDGPLNECCVVQINHNGGFV